jgi:hypothetical protein
MNTLSVLKNIVMEKMSGPKWRKQEDGGENCRMRIIVTCNFTKRYSRHPMKWMAQGEEKYIQSFWVGGGLERITPPEGLGIGWRIILKWLLKN